MAVLPGSLDYLYYNGILDHIPYEAYEMGGMPAASTNYNQMNMSQYLGGNSMQTQMNGTQYINNAMQGQMYNTYTNPDTFVKRNPNDYSQGENYSFTKNAFGINDGIGRDSDFETKAFGEEGKSFRETLVDSAKSTASGFFSMPTFIKGLIAGGIMVGTLFCLLTGKKKPKPQPQQVAQQTSFWSKLNPMRLFKK